MKMRKAIIRTLIVMMVAILGIGNIIPSLAVTEENKELTLSYFRYVNGNYSNGYALNTVGNAGESHHPVFQIMSKSNDTNYYCLNATAGESWLSGTVGAKATYNRGYDLNSSSDIDLLKNDTNEVYKNIGNSSHLNHILWILDNMYISDKKLSAEQNLAKKRELLAKAGIIYDNVIETVNMQEVKTDNMTYKYVPQTGYNFNDQLFNIKDGHNNSIYGTQETYQGWYYYDTESKFNNVELTDDIVEVAQQAAIWYFTNYLENNSANSETYNVRTQGLNLVCSNGTTETNSHSWKPLEDDIFSVETDMWEDQANNKRKKAEVGKWKQEMATILCWYLIDAANNNASSATPTSQGVPVKIAPETANLAEKTVNNTNYYVVGPVKIDETRVAVYSLNNTISVNEDTSTGAYISNAEGKKDSNQTLNNHIGKNIYIAIPKSKVSGNNIQITFDGSYKTNEKKLLISTTKTEQPVVEITPKDKPFELKVTTPIQKEFDLALRKVITKIASSDGKTKTVINEKGVNAERKVTVDTTTIPNTATYKHRKDPVVVEKGDIVTYSITIYNEGEMAGYAKTIVDKLPQGLALKGYTANKTTTGTYKSGNINYSYVYDNTNNTITFTNVSKNTLAAYAGQNNLASETIQIECEVIQEPSSSTNTYLTNIAYISGAHNTETNQDVVQDRDSRTDRNPTANQNTTGDKYTGYHGGNNNNGDNTKNVYNDGTNNDDYFPGREDDDDFEIVVIKPAVFDLALQKYIAEIMPENIPDSDSTTKVRNAPTIDTTKLANGTATTATYTQDKTPIKVKSGDYVLYNFTVYNEGQIDGYVKKITDNIPTGLEFVYAKEPKDGKTVIKCDSQGNMTEVEVSSRIYQSVITNNAFWSIDASNDILKKDTYNGESTVSITCDIENVVPKTSGGLGTPIGGGFLKAYDSSKDNNNDGSGLDRFSVKVLLRVSAQNGSGVTIRNEAAITEATDKDGNIQDVTDLKDRDSQTDKWPGKDGDKKYQDDEDYDNIILGKVDLALTKFITAISDDIKFEDGEYLTKDTTSKNAGSIANPYTRQTAVNTTPLKNGEHDAKYTQVKTPLTIPENSYVLYNIRVYNEGEVDVYAGEVKDYLPNYLDYVDCEENRNLGWSVASDGKTVTTNYLSKRNGENKILKAFDKETDDGKGSKLDYKDLPILCRVNTNAPDKTKLVNSAEITKYEDEDGNEIDKDIDSEPDNLTEKNKEKREQDDDDYEVVQIEKKKVDLALTKFIIAISEDQNIADGEYLTKDTTSKDAGSENNPYTRQTAVDTTPLKNGEHDAKYTQVKTSLTIPAESYVLYNIRVYNEGDIDVYAGEVKDYLPNYLDFVESEFNKSYGWTVSSDGKTVTTKYLSHANGADKILKAFDKIADNGKGSKLDYKDLPILCKINTSAPDKTKLINSAEITKYENKDGNEIDKDVDSEPDNLTEKNKEKREQDDDDYEVIEVKKKIVDLALSKFIAAISNDTQISDGEYLTKNGNIGSKENPYTRATEVDTTKLRDDQNCHDATYTKVKDPLVVPAQSYVLYDIRVYNEGETDVYAGEVTDHLPDYLDYVDCEFNKNFGWSVASDGKTVSTTYLSYAKGEKNLLKAFDKKTDDGKGSGLDYRDLQVLCKVNEKAPTNTNIVNVAEITKYENKHGEPIPDDDIDSKPNNVNQNNEDDDDYETVLIKTFDLSLLKYVSTVYVTENGKTTTTQTGNTGDNSKDIIPKVEINKKKLSSTVVKFGYTIKITNEGDIEGYAKEITDYVPEGLKFYAEDNNGWKDEGNNVISTRLLENTLLKPGESAEVKVIFRWINGSNNLGLKTNIAEISEDYNKEGVPDRDSTPDNKKEGEDDIDDAKVILSIKTGLVFNVVMYATSGLIILSILGIGIFAIKKYVL